MVMVTLDDCIDGRVVLVCSIECVLLVGVAIMALVGRGGSGSSNERCADLAMDSLCRAA